MQRTEKEPEGRAGRCVDVDLFSLGAGEPPAGGVWWITGSLGLKPLPLSPPIASALHRCFPTSHSVNAHGLGGGEAGAFPLPI